MYTYVFSQVLVILYTLQVLCGILSQHKCLLLYVFFQITDEKTSYDLWIQLLSEKNKNWLSIFFSQDLVQVQSGQLAHHLKKIVSHCTKHVYKCKVCKLLQSNGKFQQINHNFPFEFNSLDSAELFIM